MKILLLSFVVLSVTSFSDAITTDANEVCEGYVFTGVCLSAEGGISVQSASLSKRVSVVCVCVGGGGGGCPGGFLSREGLCPGGGALSRASQSMRGLYP